MNFLRQSTASQSRIVGPFVDDTDFKTAETGLTIANTDCKLLVNGAASVNKNSGGGTHRVNGFYSLTFDATDTATVGELQVSIVVAGALPVTKTFYVLEEAVFDALFAASATGVPASMFSTALTEAYRSDGSTGSVAQLLYEIVAHLGESVISGTTKTTRRIDGSTTAATYTLNDATTPTSITRAS